jgi:succinate dehydrogenase / fumarate reductase, cytochrome b subunit
LYRAAAILPELNNSSAIRHRCSSHPLRLDQCLVRNARVALFPNARVAEAGQLHYWKRKQMTIQVRLMARVELGPGGGEKRRPLSPHLQIYRPMLTMMMSIAHRITGAALYVGTLLLAWFLIAASIGGGTFETAAFCFNSIFGRVILFGFTWAMFHHLLGGIRHILWDAGYGFEAKQRELLAQATLFGGIALTALVWVTATFIQ